MAKKSKQNSFGGLSPKYHFSLNPYPELRFSKCPICENKTGQRKLPLVIHVDPMHLIALNYTNRYCNRCDRLIGHKHEIEHYLTEMFLEQNPKIIGNNYLILGTLEKKVWRENINQSSSVNEIRPYIHDLKSYEELRMTMGGWFHKDQEPPVMKPPISEEWVKQ